MPIPYYYYLIVLFIEDLFGLGAFFTLCNKKKSSYYNVKLTTALEFHFGFLEFWKRKIMYVKLKLYFIRSFLNNKQINQFIKNLACTFTLFKFIYFLYI